jgi:hypothetical protein
MQIITARPSATNDFAFFAGEWDVANDRRNADGVWEQFAATCSVSMCVDDLVQLDHYDAPHFPGRGHVKAVTVRAYDAAADTWSIIWLCNYAAPDFDPLVGRWDGDDGRFLQTFTDADGATVQARFIWRRLSRDHATWEQALSHDGGETWDTNWRMEMTRRAT